MSSRISAVIRGGKVELLEPVQLPEGTRVVVTPLHPEDTFWQNISQSSLDEVWNNPEDDVYGELLKR
jgi:hypothetical protein